MYNLASSGDNHANSLSQDIIIIMAKNKRPPPRKPSPEDKDEVITQLLCDLALDLFEQEDSDEAGNSAVLRQKDTDFHKLIRKTLHQNKDEVLYDAIERTRFIDIGAYQYLRSNIEEASATVLIRREGAPEMEIDAFVIPLFVHSNGGLKEADDFQDQQAFEALVASFQQAELESAKAKVVLIRHAYDLNEIDRITYCHLNEMVRDAWASMTEKKIVVTPGLERSLVGWAGNTFGAGDAAVELRFLLGFALKRADDAFYQVPQDEDAADAYFAARELRYQQWTQQVTPLLQRCLAPHGSGIELNFLYQDLFHGGKERGMAEYFMLQMMSEINHAMAQNKLAADQVTAIVAPADVQGDMVLRVNLYAMAGGAALASSEKPLDLGADLEVEVDDICDALNTLGIASLSVALKFDVEGKAVEALPYRPQ